MNTSIIRLNIRSELKLQHRVSTLHLTSSLSFLFHFSSGLFPPFSFSAPSFYLLSLITPDLLLLISPSLSPVVSLLSLFFWTRFFFPSLSSLRPVFWFSLPPSLPLCLLSFSRWKSRVFSSPSRADEDESLICLLTPLPRQRLTCLLAFNP